ncbi:uncharacterized protein LOC128222755 [Mya arenaria]|uniref:uncharacterized protein LOC128222755 n=1 Tax=Mya arenaria TaxID=6604 RepID=UPI0022E51B7C|nr:uncharacterized protein LOC128222755 [Mya arenaria]XP_052787828.1 uncharacterized protein LOC128222755 [Mya arenaria]
MRFKPRRTLGVATLTFVVTYFLISVSKQHKQAQYTEPEVYMDVQDSPAPTFDDENGTSAMEIIFQPMADVDFPSVGDGTPLIPHVFHQTHYTLYLKKTYLDVIKSLMKYNPSWEYFFWTDEGGRKLIASKYAQLLKLYDNFKNPVERSDLIRYIVLYEFGGVYLDTDIEVFRPLDRATTSFSCIIPTEPYEHSVLFYEKPYIINNAIMLCRAGHPFLKQVLDNILFSSDGKLVLDRTGPVFLTRQYNVYVNRVTKSKMKTKTKHENTSLLEPYAVRGNFHIGDIDGVYVPNTMYFNNKADRPFLYCNNADNLSTKNKTLICRDVLRQGETYKPFQYQFTVHHWFHSYYFLTHSEFKDKFSKDFDRFAYNYLFGTHIREIIPKALVFDV